MGRGIIRLCLCVAIFVGASGRLMAQQRLLEPSPAIARMLDAAPVPLVALSPDHSKLLMLERPALPPLAEVSIPALELAGLRINPRNNTPADIATYTALVVQPIGRGETRRIVIPWKARVAHTMWAPDGDRVAFTVVEDAGMSLWVADGWSGESRMLAGPVLNGAFGNPCQWLPSSSGLLCLRFPTGRGGPSAGEATLFEYHFTSQFALFPLSGSERRLGTPGIYRTAQLSPDGRYLLVESIRGPLTGTGPADALPARTEIWDLTGSVLKLVADRGPTDNATRPADAVSTGPRAIGWRNDAPSTLAWVEAQDGAAPAAFATTGDRVLLLGAPFSGAPALLAVFEWRVGEIIWGRRDLAVVTESWTKGGQTRTWLLDPSQPGGTPKLFSERSSDDRYADPGTFVTAVGPGGRPVLVTSRDGRFAFLSGAGASPEGDRPFLDRLEVSSRRLFRLWRSAAPYFEETVAVVDPEVYRIITRRESAKDAPNYFIRDLRKTGPAQLSRLTQFGDPSPEFAGVGKQLITFARRDGVVLSAILYLPAGYRPAQGTLPLLVWANPRPFRSSRTASQVMGSSYRFIRPAEAPRLALLLQGFAVLDEVALPIIGEAGAASVQGEMDQTVASATAAVRKVVAMGVADGRRIAVGGDASGGVADLLAHTDLFRAGISTHPASGPSADGPKAPLLVVQGMGIDAGSIRARESVGNALAEMAAWLDRYLKGDSARAPYRP